MLWQFDVLKSSLGIGTTLPVVAFLCVLSCGVLACPHGLLIALSEARLCVLWLAECFRNPLFFNNDISLLLLLVE